MLKLNKKGETITAQTEEELQAAVIKWRDEVGIHKWPELKWLHHAANGGKLAGRNKAEILRNGARRKQLGVVKGIPDLFLAYSTPIYNGLYIELKVGRNKPTKEQLEYRNFVKDNGYYWCCLNDFNSIIFLIEMYMSGVECVSPGLI